MFKKFEAGLKSFGKNNEHSYWNAIGRQYGDEIEMRFPTIGEFKGYNRNFPYSGKYDVEDEMRVYFAMFLTLAYGREIGYKEVGCVQNKAGHYDVIYSLD